MKRPMSVNLKRRKVTQYIIEYICPSCKTECVGHNIDSSVTRFECMNCCRELIIRSTI